MAKNPKNKISQWSARRSMLSVTSSAKNQAQAIKNMPVTLANHCPQLNCCSKAKPTTTTYKKASSQARVPAKLSLSKAGRVRAATMVGTR